jgi:hypothetical protein
MSAILLDRAGDALVPDGYLCIEDEVTFLRHAPAGRPMFIRGARLCDWAESYFRGREMVIRPAISPVQILRALCPALDEIAALRLSAKLQWTSTSPIEGMTLRCIINLLYPSNLWHEQPNLHHAAEWLLWLQTVQPDEEVLPLLEMIATEWRAQISGPITQVYSTFNAANALHILDRWLGIEPDSTSALGMFPLPIPPELVDRARTIWQRRITETQGKFFARLHTLPLPQNLLRLAAQETLAYYKAQSQHLIEADLHLLAPHLSLTEQQSLRRWLIPPLPSPMPIEIETLCHWFEHEYLPYRVWQHQFGDAESTKIAGELGQTFAEWFLTRYPQALVGGPLRSHLSFRQATVLDDPHFVTLIVVLDGLHLGDARRLEGNLREATNRLTLLESKLVFAPLPTITEMTKEPLLRGVPPARTLDVEPLGFIIQDMADPIAPVTDATPGALFFWRIREPDYTYHSRNTAAALHHDVEAALDNVARKLADIVESSPAKQPLKLILTTDHGRLLATSQRIKPVPPGMQSHGRAAWGTAPTRAFPASGYLIEDDVVYLHHERFGLPEDAAIVLTEDAFLTNDGRGGPEHYAHGGLFPEEVIVPWLVFARDWRAPEVGVRVSGDGVANTQAVLNIEVVNYSDQPLHLTHLLVTVAGATYSLPLEGDVEPRGTLMLQRNFGPWPKPIACPTAQTTLGIRLITGGDLNIPGEITLESQELYSRPNILEGLDL